MRKALITGITGQDGSYLAEFLLDKGYEVHGLVRKCSSFSTERIDHLIRDPSLFEKRFFYHWGDLTDSSNINGIIQLLQPDEIYNMGAQSHVKVSFEVPEFTANTDALGAMRIVDAVLKYCPQSKVYQASTSEMYGGLQDEMPPQGFDETTPFHPRSPYGVAKVYAYWIARNYREAYGLYACNGLLFNHESPRRGETFVTRKITRWFRETLPCLISSTPQIPHPLELGNLHAARDWGHAKDYVRAMWMVLQQETPEDYVVATGHVHTVKNFVEACFQWIGLEIQWLGVGEAEVGFVKIGTQKHLAVRVHRRYFRPAEVPYLKGNAQKIRQIGWKPEYDFASLVNDMMIADCGDVQKKYRQIFHNQTEQV